MAIAGSDTESGAASKDPDQIRREIERTRRELGSDVDALADKVTPSKIMQRQTGKIRNALGSVSDRVMGSASQASDAVGELPHTAAAQAKGNPMAVGLIAFGVGWLAASLVPATASEQRMAAQIKDAAAPLVDEAVGAAKSVGESLKEPAQNAATAVKDAATEAVDTVKGEAVDAKDAVTDQARRSANDVEL
ncbi:DUF3618 domain-containing protein [Cryobacterium melibiosiphilum]|uniref:DUF3618 domain-containing protein n=2 Tax=Cryobacterium melibiosiphilum TaxID=995039 RepID=A0A3A5MYR6_9MICO|nr:DUF3618 domain-containing protein [Cryobacterium melibiosiphilum]